MTNSSSWADAVNTVRYDVYLGTWVNYSRGRIMGATLTLDRMYGNLLIAFTATFVGIVTASLWRIGCLVLHRFHSTSDPRDTLHHQRQAVLRNSASPASGLWVFLQLGMTYRREGLLMRTLPGLLFAGLCLSAFTIAGGFSSSISSAVGNEVLLDGKNCGFILSNGASASLSNYATQTIDNAANYAQQCYTSNATGIFDCQTFVKGHVPGTLDDQAACPFTNGPGLCRSNDSNIFLDTGYLDSREDFGVNTPDDERIFFRATLHCAPLNSAGLARNVTTASDNYTEYYYGPVNSKAKPTNFTWQVEDLYSQYIRQSDNTLGNWGSSLEMSALSAQVANSTVWEDYSMFDPDSQLFRPDGDIYLIFLSGNGVYYEDPTYDPWYRGFVPDRSTTYLHENDSFELYRPDEAASPMGCIQQYQFCNADRECGNLASFADAAATAAPMFNTSQDVFWGDGSPSGRISSQFLWFQEVIYGGFDLLYLLQSLGTASLASRKYFQVGTMSQVPDDQWKLDVTTWWAIILAEKQASFINVAHGPTDPDISEYITAPANEYMKEMCHNQKILSTSYTSFSLFGLYFTLVTGILIIGISYSLEPIFAYLYRHQRPGAQGYKYLEWTTNQTLQLQRLAYQGLGSEAWSGYRDTIPTTRTGYFLADLPLSYPEEPTSKELQLANPPKSNTSSRLSTKDTRQEAVSDSVSPAREPERTAGARGDCVSPL